MATGPQVKTVDESFTQKLGKLLGGIEQEGEKSPGNQTTASQVTQQEQTQGTA